MTTGAALSALPPPPLPLRTERLVLRPVTLTDTDAIAAYCADPAVTRFLPFPTLDAAGAAERVARMASSTHPRADGEMLALAVEHEGRLVGDLLLRLVGAGSGVGEGPSGPAMAEVGWVIAPQAQRRGFASEAAAALVDLAFDHFGLHRLIARLDPANLASAVVCERLGMRHEAHLRGDYLEDDGSWGDTTIYGLLRTDRR
ncbi:GNAT family N-acetyltransferase [Nocardioides sp.]|uniref:GNAT family N-acetyltransferase n=1 Tax=Nocardioides sp. TaxID=35761 RepID=UPI003510E3FA